MTTDGELLPTQPIALPPASIGTTSLLAKAEWEYTFTVLGAVLAANGIGLHVLTAWNEWIFS
jgi:hypothetical protein